MAKFVPVPADCIIGKLTEAGFVEEAEGHGDEQVFVRPNHHIPALKVLVYTSIRKDAWNVRGRGADAIRVVLVYDHSDGKRYGITKATRVFRCGDVEGVLSRMVERMRQMYGFANKLSVGPLCACGAPRSPASGRCYRFRDCICSQAGSKVA